LELWAAVGVLVRKFVTGASLVLTLTLVVFLAALVSAWARGLSISCGCFGQSEPVTEYSGVIIRDLVFIALAVFVLLRSLKSPAQA
ncbi:MAG: MauE/DoxX family redox-associated membrane protein, partial [Verrucomicrobiota bacterium]